MGTVDGSDSMGGSLKRGDPLSEVEWVGDGLPISTIPIPMDSIGMRLPPN